MKYPTYPEYRSTGLGWLPQIPVTWQLHRLKWTVTSCDNGVWGDEPDGGPDDIVCLRVADFDRATFRIGTDKLTVRSVDEGQRKSRQLRAGDLLIEKSGGGDKQLVGCVVQFDHNFAAVCSNFVARMAVAPGQCSRYWAYAHAALYAGRLNYPAIKQTTGIQNLDAGEYLNLQVAYPSIAEQEHIANFLDWKTGQIDTLIAKKEALIGTLDEQCRALTARAIVGDVANGSGATGWFGELQPGWRAQRIKFIGRIGNGSTPNRDEAAYWDSGTYPWLNSSVVNQDEVTEADQFVTEIALKECHLPRISPPAVLIGITGQGKTRGMSTTLRFEATINQHIAFVKPDESVMDIDYLRAVFDAAYPFLRSQSEGGGSTKGAITCEQIAELAVPVPPISIQRRIAKEIGRRIRAIKDMRAAAQSAVERLNEYRSALITAAVAGEIDVRGVPFSEADWDGA